MHPISPLEPGIIVRPIARDDLDRIVLRCWPERAILERLFDGQGTIGMAAWEGDTCVAQLHAYRVELPIGTNPAWPAWNDWWSPRWNLSLARQARLTSGSAWCHACIHVGRTLAAALHSDEPDSRYFGRGIGTALCNASVAWADEHGYRAVIAPGCPVGLFRFAVWAGGLPLTTYTKLGFRAIVHAEAEPGLPAWAQGNAPPDVMAEVKAVRAAGRSDQGFHSWIMVRRF